MQSLNIEAEKPNRVIMQGIKAKKTVQMGLEHRKPYGEER
jgi:hypothetical protein